MLKSEAEIADKKSVRLSVSAEVTKINLAESDLEIADGERGEEVGERKEAESVRKEGRRV